jgi:hypothetical protein
MLAIAHSQTRTDDANETTLRKLVEQAYGSAVNEKIQAVLETLVNDAGGLVEFLKSSYRVESQLPPGPTLKTVGRGAHIAGQVLGTAADERRLTPLTKPFAWLARLGQLFSGMVEAAVPGSWAHLVVRHWMVLIYLFEVLAFGMGLLFGESLVQRFGLLALLVTLLLNLTLWALKDRIQGGKVLKMAIGLVAVLAIAGVIALAVLELVHLGKGHPWIPVFGRG